MALETKPFDVADYLTNDETIAGYLTEALDGNDPREVVQALADVTRARGGIPQLASATGVTEAELGRALDADGNPDLETLLKIIRAFGVKMRFTTPSVVAPTQEKVAA